jgi:hypothetical protein
MTRKEDEGYQINICLFLIVKIAYWTTSVLMPNPWPSPWRKQDSEATSTISNHFTAFFTNAHTQFKALPPSVIVLTTFTLGSATAMSVVMIHKRFGRRIRNVDWVTPALLSRKRWIKGVVTRYQFAATELF